MVIKSADEATEPTHSANVATIPAFHLSLRCPIIPSAEFWCYIGKYWFVLCDRPPENKNKNTLFYSYKPAHIRLWDLGGDWGVYWYLQRGVTQNTTTASLVFYYYFW